MSWLKVASSVSPAARKLGDPGNGVACCVDVQVAFVLWGVVVGVGLGVVVVAL